MEPPNGGSGPPQTVDPGKLSELSKEMIPNSQENIELQPPKDFNVLQNQITEHGFQKQPSKDQKEMEEETRNELNILQNQISDNVFQGDELEHSKDVKEQPPNEIKDLESEVSENVFKDINTEIEKDLTTNLQTDLKEVDDNSQGVKLDPSKVPSVPPKEIVIKRKKPILPARRVPKYIPDVDGNQWKVWPYPEVVELSTDSEEDVSEDPGLPPGVRRFGDVYEGDLAHDEVGPPLYHKIVRGIQGTLASLYTFSVVKFFFTLWKNYFTREVDEKPPGTTEDESEKEDANIG